MKYFIAAYYNENSPGQTEWVNSSFFPALEMGANLLEPSWPGQACEISAECAIPVSVANPAFLPCTIILENQGNGQFREVARKCGNISADEIVDMLSNADIEQGGGGINPLTEGEGINPLGLFNVPWWVLAVAALLLFNKEK